MSKLPSINWRDTIKFLGRLGFRVVHQRGSHIYLTDKSGEHKVTVPRQDPIKKGTLLSIIEQAGLNREEFVRLLNE